MAAAAGRGRTRDKVGHTSVLWRGARVGILFLIIYTVVAPTRVAQLKDNGTALVISEYLIAKIIYILRQLNIYGGVGLRYYGKMTEVALGTVGNLKILQRDDTFQPELAAAGVKLVVVDFFATW